MVAAFIQARMASRRFPGKVLAPFRGEPMIAHLLRLMDDVVGREQVTVLTSTHPSDDPLAAYVSGMGTRVFRGPLDDVFERFRQCAGHVSPDWVLRICADSPLLSPRVVRCAISRIDEVSDLITTTAPRTLPKGQNPELIRRTVLLSTPASELTPADREHVTAYYYRHPDRYRIVNMTSGRPDLAGMNLSVDTPEDLRRLEAMSAAEIDALLPSLTAPERFVSVSPSGPEPQ